MIPTSLRGRLFLMIIGPLVLVACLSSIVRYGQFSLLSRQLYDNVLLTVALTISRDVTSNEGDMLKKSVLDALAESLGDAVYYRITGPAGAYVTGYSDSPAMPAHEPLPPGTPFYFDAEYMGRPVRGLYMTEAVHDMPDNGLVTMEVWQTVNQRQRLSLQLLSESAAYFSILLFVAALAVWYGIRRGLKPLEHLETEIAARSPEELGLIRTNVPTEIGTVVSAMNSLFCRLREAFAIRDNFISDAAHQMRTPIAGIQAQAEAALTARSEMVLRERVSEVAFAARAASRLTQQLLSLERVHGRTLRSLTTEFDLENVIRGRARQFAERVMNEGIDVQYKVQGTARPFSGDEVLIAELLNNLLENAEKYGTASEPVIVISIAFDADQIRLMVHDNGPGVEPDARIRVFDRFFRQVPEGVIGCGLGLAIVREVAERHNGRAAIIDSHQGCCVCVTFASGP